MSFKNYLMLAKKKKKKALKYSKTEGAAILQIILHLQGAFPKC